MWWPNNTTTSYAVLIVSCLLIACTLRVHKYALLANIAVLMS